VCTAPTSGQTGGGPTYKRGLEGSSIGWEAYPGWYIPCSSLLGYKQTGRKGGRKGLFLSPTVKRVTGRQNCPVIYLPGWLYLSGTSEWLYLSGTSVCVPLCTSGCVPLSTSGWVSPAPVRCNLSSCSREV